MNNLSPHLDQSDDHKTEYSPMMRFGKRLVHYWAVYSALGILTAALFILVSYFGVSYQVTQQVTQQLSGLSGKKMKEPVVALGEKETTTNLINQLKQYGLWEFSASEKVPRFFIRAYPADLNLVEDISVRKRIFLHSLLPHALFVRQEALQKRGKFESILSKIDCADETLDFGNESEFENQCS